MKKLLVIFFALTLAGLLLVGSFPTFAAENAATTFTNQNSLPSRGSPAGDPGRTRVCLTPGDGSPMPVCAPGKNCNNDEERKVLAAV